jgi:hypothetical protein
MTKPASKSPPTSIDATLELLGAADYVADRSLATVLFLALKMGRPLFLEGEAGVGKTEIAKVLSGTLGRRLIRLQCYEGLDVAAAGPKLLVLYQTARPDDGRSIMADSHPVAERPWIAGRSVPANSRRSRKLG